MPRIKGLVLAAGRGERLRPLTGFLPKALLPVTGGPVARLSLDALARVGCEGAAINLHHLGDRIERTFGSRAGDLPLVYSHETELLGTLGALRPLAEFFREADLIVILNGDSLCRWPLRRLLRRHMKSGALATLLLARRADPGEYGGGVALDASNRILELRRARRRIRATDKVRRRVFAGAQVLSAELLRRVPEQGSADLVADLYEPILAEGGKILGVETARRWHDLGTPARYLAGVFDWARGNLPLRLMRRRFIARGARLERRTRVRRSVVESGVVIERGARLDRCLVLTGARVGARCRLVRTLVAPGVVLPPRTEIRGHMVTPLKAGRDPSAHDSVVGDLVYTPIDPEQR